MKDVNTILKLAYTYAIKVATKNDVKPHQLYWLDEDSQKELKTWGNQYPVEDNPPAWIASEKTWDKAKKAVRKYWDKYETPWAVVADVYYNMGGKVKKKKKGKKKKSK